MILLFIYSCLLDMISRQPELKLYEQESSGVKVTVKSHANNNVILCIKIHNHILVEERFKTFDEMNNFMKKNNYFSTKSDKILNSYMPIKFKLIQLFTEIDKNRVDSRGQVNSISDDYEELHFHLVYGSQVEDCLILSVYYDRVLEITEKVYLFGDMNKDTEKLTFEIANILV